MSFLFSLWYHLGVLRAQLFLGHRFVRVYTALLDEQIRKYEQQYGYPTNQALAAIVVSLYNSPDLPPMGGLVGWSRKCRKFFLAFTRREP